MPYRIPCETEFSDGYGFSLEANTENKYNCVFSGTCNEDKSKFAAVCQEIVKCAGLEKQIDLLWFTKPQETKTVQGVTRDVTIADVKEDSNYNKKKRGVKNRHKTPRRSP
jgi:hypothetical protein